MVRYDLGYSMMFDNEFCEEEVLCKGFPGRNANLMELLNFSKKWVELEYSLFTHNCQDFVKDLTEDILGFEWKRE